MTLEEYRKAKHEDFFLAVISKVIDLEDEWFPVILLKQGENYIHISEMKELCTDEYEIKCLVPLKDYYKEDEYSFEEDEGGIYLNIEPYPFNMFATDYEEGKIR